MRYSFKTTKVWVGFPLRNDPWPSLTQWRIWVQNSKLLPLTPSFFPLFLPMDVLRNIRTFQRVRMRQQNDNFSHFQTKQPQKSENISSLKRLDSTTTTSLKPTFDPHFRRSFLHLKRSLFSGGYATFYQPLFNTWTTWVQLLEKWLMIKVQFFVKNVLNEAWN